MSWNSHVKAPREEIRTAIQNAASSPPDLTGAPADHFEFAKRVALDIIDELGDPVPAFAVSMSGHTNQGGELESFAIGVTRAVVEARSDADAEPATA